LTDVRTSGEVCTKNGNIIVTNRCNMVTIYASTEGDRYMLHVTGIHYSYPRFRNIVTSFTIKKRKKGTVYTETEESESLAHVMSFLFFDVAMMRQLFCFKLNQRVFHGAVTKQLRIQKP